MDWGTTAGDTNVTIYVRLRDSTTGLAKPGLAFNSAGAVCSYVLPGAARAAITLATQTVTGAHADGGFVEVDATNCKGLYRLDLPDAAVASGAYSLISIEFDGIIEETVIVPLSSTPQTGDSFARLGAPAGASVSADVAAVKSETATIAGYIDTEVAAILAAVDTEVAAILADTDELQGDWANGGRLDLLLDAIKAVTDALPDSGALTSIATVAAQTTAQNDLDTITGTDGATLATAQALYAPAKAGDEMDLVDAPNATAITAIQNGLATASALTTVSGKIDTIDDFLDTEIAAILAAVDTEVASILEDTGTTLPATLAGLMTTAMTEGYRSAGATGSVRDLLYEILAHLGEFAISSTTKTLKRLDGTTTAKTSTLNDDTSPTAITETT